MDLKKVKELFKKVGCTTDEYNAIFENPPKAYTTKEAGEMLEKKISDINNG